MGRDKKLRPGRRTGVYKICPICGKEFYVQKHAIPRAKYCSRKCARESSKTPKKKCAVCGKYFKPRAGGGNPCCSVECGHIYRKTGEYRKCDNCGKEIYVRACMLKSHKNHFCGSKCSNEYQGRNKVGFICKVCGKEFKWSPSRVTNGKHNPKYCSIKCRNDDPDWDGHIKANLAQQNKKKLNSIEKIGHEILNNLEEDFKEQVLIEGKFIVDAFIPSCGIIVQWDGDYWHGYGKSIDEVEDRVANRMKLDKSQDAYMKKCGYTILRFWEHDLHDNKEAVYENIKRAVQNSSR